MLLKILRWLLIPVCMAVVGIGGALLGRWLVARADARCDPGNMVAGACVEPWQTGAVETTIYAMIVLVALLLTLLPALLAPAFQRTVAVICGAVLPLALVAVYVRFGWADFLIPTLIAAVIAALTVGWVFSRRKKHAS